MLRRGVNERTAAAMSEIKSYENVTLFICTMFGFRRTLCRTLTVETGRPYAQHTNATRVEFVEKGKRSKRAFVSYGFGGGRTNSFIVLAGYHDDFTGGWLQGTGDGGSRSKWASCAIEWDYDFNKALDKYSAEVSGDVEILHDDRFTKATEAPVAEAV